MTGPWLALLLAALPDGRVAWRMELAGRPVGVVELEVRCAAGRCAVTWRSRQRLPAEAGGVLLERKVRLEVDPDGRELGPARVTEGGVGRDVALPPGAVPALLVETVALRRLASGPGGCLDAADELTGRPLRACGSFEAGRLRLELGGERELVWVGEGGFPDQVLLPGQRIRFVRDPRAAVPTQPPRLFGVEVDGPAEPARAARFCGVTRDRRSEASTSGLPAARAEGATCRDQAAAWLAEARGAGWRGRTAVGVAWSGAAWSWHAWAEVRIGEAWVPIDPTFGESPVRSPRFTLATWEEGDEPARAEAGRRILACWGRARVEP